MKLGIIMPPAPESFEKAKEMGLDFIEFDCNPPEFSASRPAPCWRKRRP